MKLSLNFVSEKVFVVCLYEKNVIKEKHKSLKFTCLGPHPNLQFIENCFENLLYSNTNNNWKQDSIHNVNVTWQRAKGKWK